MPDKKFKIMSVVGTRPALIRMHKLLALLDEHQEAKNYEHVFVHTGQHFDRELDGIFYEQMGIRQPDYNLGVGKILKQQGGPQSFEYQMSVLFPEISKLLEKERPNLVVYLGDTNTELSAIVVSRHSIPIAHIEAGGRSYDWRMPEEKNRTIIDHLADICYSYVPRYREILLQEGLPEFRIKVIGNIIYDAVESFLPLAEKSPILEENFLTSGSYILVTLHREENINEKIGLEEKLNGLIKLAKEHPVVWPIMPRVKANLENFGLWDALKNSGIKLIKPQGYLEFLKLQKYAKVVISDSGSVQEEALILGVPCVVARTSTERPETLLAGAGILANTDLYQNTLKALAVTKSWDKYALNPTRQSPSVIIFEDLMDKIQNGFFKASRSYDWLKSSRFVREACGNFDSFKKS